jgi:superfamily II DNA/RNA helicase
MNFFLWSVLISLWIPSIISHQGNLVVVVSAFATSPESKPRSSSPKRLEKNGNNRLLSSSINKNKKWFHQRKAGISVPRGKKPPQWEKEGDYLYTASNKVHCHQDSELVVTPQTIGEARELLRPLEQGTTTSFRSKETKSENEDPHDKQPDPDDKPFLWGTLPVGPIWKNRLLQLGYQEPTPIQVETFHAVLSKKKQKRQNVVIASPTGTGKSLAFLLPFLTTLNVSQKTNNNNNNNKATKTSSTSSSVGKVWILTPTVELAFQIQQVVQRLFRDDNCNEKRHLTGESTRKIGNANRNSIMHVLQRNNNDGDGHVKFPLLAQILDAQHELQQYQQPVLLAGTPKLFLQLRKEIKTALSQYTRDIHADHSTKILAKALHSNLEAVILDEADRLLPTKHVATSKSLKPGTTSMVSISAAHELLISLVMDSSSRPSGHIGAPPSSSLQVVCVSATVGRGLRRQLMQILGAPSVDKAAVLVTADMRTKKSANDRKMSLLPINLKHSYKLVVEDDESSPALLRGLLEAMELLDPKPSIIFPGPFGVEQTQQFLTLQGFQCVRGLYSLREEVSSNSVPNTNNNYGVDWTTTPLYVIKERLGRGLDLPEVKYVMMLGVPSNAASYAHLAGRTARNGEIGMAITLCQPKETPKLVTLAESFGLTFSCLERKSSEKAQ